MGTARGNGYRVDNPCPLPTTSSPKLNGCTPVAALSSPRKKTPPSGVPSSTARPPVNRRLPGERVHRHRRHKSTGCRNPQVRKGIGSCVFVLGIPCLIAGLILTIVSSTEDDGDGRKYPSAFPVLGPVLLGLSMVCFLIGVLLYDVAILQWLQDCLGLSSKDSLCRRRCPRLYAWLKPDPNQVRNQMAINNLQTAPARSAMRKIPNPDLVVLETDLKEGQGQGHHPHGYDLGHHQLHQYGPRRKRAVTFSQGYADPSEGGFVGVRLSSTSSEPDRFPEQSEHGLGSSLSGHSPSSSLLSLRHCRIYPKDEVLWTDSSGANKGGEGGRGGVEVNPEEEEGMGVDGGCLEVESGCCHLRHEEEEKRRGRRGGGEEEENKRRRRRGGGEEEEEKRRRRGGGEEEEEKRRRRRGGEEEEERRSGGEEEEEKKRRRRRGGEEEEKRRIRGGEKEEEKRRRGGGEEEEKRRRRRGGGEEEEEKRRRRRREGEEEEKRRRRRGGEEEEEKKRRRRGEEEEEKRRRRRGGEEEEEDKRRTRGEEEEEEKRRRRRGGEEEEEKRRRRGGGEEEE
ncbi:hypothetical protein ACOMHN_026717 [Nucella lapillus]